MAFCEMLWYLFVTFVVVQLARLAWAEADLTLLFREKFGKKPGCLRKKVVWVTGASSGIGECLVYDLARAGCRLVLSARGVDELERVRQNCIDFWNVKEEDVMVLKLDLLDYDTHKSATQEVIEKMGTIDILVNNGGRSQRALIEDTDLAVDRAMIELNVLGTISLTKAVLPHFKKKESGHVVVTSSVAGKLGAPLSASYTASKFALQGWSDTLRIEYAQYNVKVTTVCPGPVYSKVTDNAFTGNLEEKLGVAMQQNENRMMTERCSELMTSAIANQLDEVWISRQPILLFTYAAQYLPDIYRWLGLRMGMRMIKKIRES